MKLLKKKKKKCKGKLQNRQEKQLKAEVGSFWRKGTSVSKGQHLAQVVSS